MPYEQAVFQRILVAIAGGHPQTSKCQLFCRKPVIYHRLRGRLLARTLCGQTGPNKAIIAELLIDLRAKMTFLYRMRSKPFAEKTQ